MKNKKINFYFPKKDSQPITSYESPSTLVEVIASNTNSSTYDEKPLAKVPRLDVQPIDAMSIERDPGKRLQIWNYNGEQQDEIRRAYIRAGPYQHDMSKYPLNEKSRRFQFSWLKLFSDWLEYSPTKDAIFCLSCYLFSKPSGRVASGAFIIEGFRSWKKVNGEKCALLSHVRKDPNSPHKRAIMNCRDLMNQMQHIQKVIEKQTFQQVANNRLLKTSIDAIRWPTFQACAFRGHNERLDSTNPGNFIQMVKILASYNEKVSSLVLDNASHNASYTSPGIQKEILQVFAIKVKDYIRKEIGDAKFCIIVDEARDESKREQMAIVLRFVDEKGYVKEQFFDLVHVSDTKSLTLKKEIFNVLQQHNLNVRDIRGQGYDGASNMRGEWSGLQTLVSNEYPYAYYIHCFAHRLQLALVATSKEVILVHQFYGKLTTIINAVDSSCKRHDQLHDAQASEIRRLISLDELDMGKGMNQIGTLNRAGDTR